MSLSPWQPWRPATPLALHYLMTSSLRRPSLVTWTPLVVTEATKNNLIPPTHMRHWVHRSSARWVTCRPSQSHCLSAATQRTTGRRRQNSNRQRWTTEGRGEATEDGEGGGEAMIQQGGQTGGDMEEMQGQGLAIPTITPPTGGGAGKEERSANERRDTGRCFPSFLLQACFLFPACFWRLFFSSNPLSPTGHLWWMGLCPGREWMPERVGSLVSPLCLHLDLVPGQKIGNYSSFISMRQNASTLCGNKYYQIFFLKLIIS